MRMWWIPWTMMVAMAVPFIVPPQGFAQSAALPSSEPSLSSGYKFGQVTGEDLFAHICRGCHMADARGAVGAGSYPSLMGDRNLEAGGYALHVVVNGRRAMPPFGAMLSDDQVAAVVNYLRTHFQNDYRDAVTADDVKGVRP